MTHAAAGTAFDRVTEALRADGRKVSTRKESEARAKCPAHDGTSDDSLSIQRTEDRALIHCFSGCDRQDVLAALNMADRDLFDQPRTTYSYSDPTGTLARTVTRSYDAGKRTFRQSVHEKGPTTLYRLPELAAAPPSVPVYLVEGEEDVHAVEAAGGIGTTAPQGAGNFHHANVEPLRGRVVVAVVDKDQAGQKWAASVREKVAPVAAVLSFKQARTGKDFSDHLAAGYGLFDLDTYVTPDVEPEAPAAPDGFDDIRARLVDGGSFILDAPDNIPAVWGIDSRVLWAEGEALVIAGPSGVGKTTVAGQLVRGLILGETSVLGLPVARRGRVLYLAMDRPRQAARALRRTLGDIPRHVLADRLWVWQGPPIADIAKHPETLLGLAEIAEADIVIVDSLKDAAVGLKEDEVGAGYNRARQGVLAAGIDVLELHHLVKRGPNGGAPKALADLFGSVWITAGAGSVILLWGEAGDPVVELKHLKQPGEEVGPLTIAHDHDAGLSHVSESVDLEVLARRPSGVTAKQAAVTMFRVDKPSAAEVAKARRKLGALTRSGRLVEEPGDDATNRPAVWRTAPNQTLTPPPYGCF